ncbi:MAG: nucleoside deaminase [Oculatellaceae cyanobacterium Prado106]|jgi:tRNA(adenine34) deaminase|nr:nucleoside deaminase [Oculatellaceae cyanobacterium Prado106]
MDIPPPFLDHPEYLIHYYWMKRAIALATEAGNAGEVPVGAVIVDANQVDPSQTIILAGQAITPGKAIAEGQNRRERDHDPTAHAEIVALRQAGQALQSWHLDHCTLYVTLEPCPMCAGALIQARLGKLVYGADDPKAGAIRTVTNLPDGPCSNHRFPVLGGILGTPCAQQLQAWFAQRRHS